MAQLPATLTTISGRGDGGRHLFFRRPPGKLTKTQLPAGLEYKDHGGYVVLCTVHPPRQRGTVCPLRSPRGGTTRIPGAT